MVGKEPRGMEIHIQRDGQQMGPYTLEQINEYLAQGSLLATDHAWHEGLPQWVPLNQAEGVIVPGASTPPPFDPAAFSPSLPPLETPGSTCPQCQASVEPNQVICVGCGANLQTGQSISPAVALPQKAANFNKSKIIKIAGGVIGGIVILSVVGFFIAKNSTTNNLLKVHNAIVEAEGEYVSAMNDSKKTAARAMEDFKVALKMRLDGQRDPDRWGNINDCPTEYKAQVEKLKTHLYKLNNLGGSMDIYLSSTTDASRNSEFMSWEQQRQEIMRGLNRIAKDNGLELE